MEDENPFEREFPARPIAVWQDGQFLYRTMQPPFYPKEPGEQRPGIMYAAEFDSRPVELQPYKLRDGSWRVNLPSRSI